MVYLIIKSNYVINRIQWDGVTQIDHGGDTAIEDIGENVCIGDWYEEAEGVFYGPRSKPNDDAMPEELNTIWDNQLL